MYPTYYNFLWPIIKFHDFPGFSWPIRTLSVGSLNEKQRYFIWQNFVVPVQIMWKFRPNKICLSFRWSNFNINFWFKKWGLQHTLCLMLSPSQLLYAVWYNLSNNRLNLHPKYQAITWAQVWFFITFCLYNSYM